MKYKRFISYFLASSIFITSSIVSINAADSDYVTRGEAAEIILETAKDYNINITTQDIIKGNGNGDLRKNEKITKIEAAVMLSRGFGDLPEPKGNNLRLGNFDEDYSDIPFWAEDDVENLKQAGILVGKDKTTLGSNEYLTEGELNLIIKRLFRLFGNNPNDEFYEYKNKAWLDTAVFNSGSPSNGTLNKIDLDTTAKLEATLDALLKSEYPNGSKEQIISDFYKNNLNYKERNKEGIAPLKSYLAEIDNLKSIDEILNYDVYTRINLGACAIIDINKDSDFADSNKKSFILGTMYPYLPKDSYSSEDTKTLDAYRELIEKLLMLSGENSEAAKENSSKIIEIESKLSKVILDPQDAYNVDKAYKTMSIDELDKNLSNIDVKNIIKSIGFNYKDDEKITIYDYNSVLELNKLLIEDNIDTLKSCVKINLLLSLGKTLSKDFIDAFNNFNQKLNGAESAPSEKEQAVNATLSLLGDYVGQIYAEKYTSAKAKEDIESMIKEMVIIYKERISNIDWMSSETKAKAIKKLDTIKYKVAYPDNWDDYLSGYEIKSYKNGGSLFDNYITSRTASYDQMIKEQNSPVDKSVWGLNIYDVNAYYMPLFNEIVIPAGIMQAPLYDENASRSTNLGAIGAIIAHELSHAFDNNGSKFDEHGNVVNWWTAEDSKIFEEKCKAIEAFYNTEEIYPGLTNNGTLTLGENIADLSGLMVALEVAKTDSEYNPKEFFDSYANVWKNIYTKEYSLLLSKMDVHSNARIRVIKTVQNLPEFYETYNIKENDGMYVAPENRVKVW